MTLAASLPLDRSDVGPSCDRYRASHSAYPEVPFSPRNYGVNEVQKSYGIKRNSLCPVADKIGDALSSAPVKFIANIAGVSDSTVENWRAKKSVPDTDKAIIIAQRVQKLDRAIRELLGDDRLLAPLLASLVEIAHSSDEISASRARKALEDYAAMKRGAG